DGSTDTTLKNLKKHFDNDPFLRIVTYKENQGKGFALRKGFSYCSGDLIAFLDADLDLHPNQLDGLYRKMVKEGADVVIGSKFHPQSKLIYPIHRKMISIIYCLILYLLFRLPLKDTQTGLKLFKKEVLDRVFPRILCKRFAFDVELLANAYRLHYKIKEVPVVLNFRRNRKWGRMRLKDMWYAGLDTLAIFYRMYILKYYEKGRNIMNIP
ncbi:glycosyltransferase, partial [Patescibacteria group bacterium]|nr:glycosyltransferase [Patescibacteria group bacterium]